MRKILKNILKWLIVAIVIFVVLGFCLSMGDGIFATIFLFIAMGIVCIWAHHFLE